MFCFCTLAMGKSYRQLARFLAIDLYQYAPGISLLLLSDDPHLFDDLDNVIALLHRQHSIGCYHDKRFALEAALERYETAIYVDANVRILEPVPFDREWSPGITARSTATIYKHNHYRGKPSELWQAIKVAAQKLDLDLDHVKFLHEFMFTLKRDGEKTADFFRWWGKLANFFEARGIYHGEGNSIGLAASKAGLVVQYDDQQDFRFRVFKDVITQEEMKIGKIDSDMFEQYRVYFEIQTLIESPSSHKIIRIKNRLKKFLKRSIQLSNLQLRCLWNPKLSI